MNSIDKKVVRFRALKRYDNTHKESDLGSSDNPARLPSHSLVSKKPFAILGAGGHAAVIAGLLSEVARALRGVVTPNEKLGPFGLPWLGELPPPIGEVELANGIGAADTKGISRRASEFERYIDSGYGFPPLIHPRAFVAREATIGPGTQLMAGAILQPYAQIGRNVIVNTGAQIDHHCCIGDHAHIAPGAILCGDVTVEAGAMVGAGAVVLPGSKVTTGTLVKAASRFPLRGRLDRGLERPRAIRPLAG